ncbi:MAG: hypothetical protein AAGI63_09990 [Planctomycetota bacterium]
MNGPDENNFDSEESLEIGVNPHALADSLCDEFVIEIDPLSDAVLLNEVFDLIPDTWHPLEAIRDTVSVPLPDYMVKLLACAPKQIFIRHTSWIGREFDSEHPSYMVTIANAASLGVNTFLIDVPRPDIG